MRRALLALALAVVPACGSGGGAAGAMPPIVPLRHATAGDRLLDALPPGADLVVEIDLARLRRNPVVGEMARALLAAPPPDAAPVPVPMDDAPLGTADAVVLAAYRVGTPEATTLTLAHGGAKPANGIALGGERWALIAEGDTAAVLEAAGDGDDLTGDAELLAARAWAMPAAAEGAALRITARLPVAARAALAESLGVAAVPARVSVWGDVVDDLAVVAQLADEPDGRGGARAAKPAWLPAVHALRDRVAALPELGALGLARPVADADIRRDGAGVRVAVVIAPGRLRRAVARWSAHRGAAP